MLKNLGMLLIMHPGSFVKSLQIFIWKIKYKKDPIIIMPSVVSAQPTIWHSCQMALKDRLEVEWLLALAGPPASGWWCHWQAMHSTRLSGLVQAMSRHTCWTPIIYRVSVRLAGSSGLHCTYDQQSMSLPTIPSLNLHYKKKTCWVLSRRDAEINIVGILIILLLEWGRL